VHIVLEGNHAEYRPSMISLTHAVNIAAKELISIMAVVPRLRDVMLNNESNPAAAAAASPAHNTATADSAQAADPGMWLPHPDLNSTSALENEQQPDAALQQPAAGAFVPGANSTFYQIISNDNDTLNIVVQVG